MDIGSADTTHFVYDQGGRLIGEYDATGTPIAEYVYLADQPLAMLRGGAIYYYHTDHLGTPQALTDQDRRLVWRADYTPFGDTMILVNEIENPLRFPGQYFDQETGLHYNYFRDYDPTIGRYTQSDPIGLRGGQNTYGYVGGNPIRFWDRSGLEGFPSDFADIDSSRATRQDISNAITGTLFLAAFFLVAGATVELAIAELATGSATIAKSTTGSALLTATSLGTTLLPSSVNPDSTAAARVSLDVLTIVAALLRVEPIVVAGLAAQNITFDILSVLGFIPGDNSFVFDEFVACP
jgi:RHS repeat-associated protein